MRKLLSRFFSVALIASLTAVPVLAQHAVKVKKSGRANTTATVSAFSKAKAKRNNAKHDVSLTDLTRKSFMPKGMSVAKKGKIAAPKKITSRFNEAPADLPDIYGSVIYNSTFTSDYAPTGIYKIANNGNSDCEMVVDGADATAGGIVIDNVYYATSYFSFWGMLFIDFAAYDLDSGEVEWSNSNLESFEILAVGGEVVDPVTSKVYGVTYNADGSGYQLSEIDINDSAQTVTATAIAALDGMYTGLCIDGSGQIYALKEIGDYASEGSFICSGTVLCKLDKTTGAVTEVGEAGLAPAYIGGAVIDSKTNKMYYNLNTSDGSAYMTEIDLATGAGTVLYEFKNDDEVVGMYIPATAAEPTAPAACENVALNFEGNSLTGNVSLKAPSTLFDGTAGSGELGVIVLVDGEQLGYKECSWGENVTVDLDLTLQGAGLHTFTVFAWGDGGEGPKTTLKNQWIGADTPEATSASLAYVNGNMEITWTPVTASVNGGYLDLDNITYTVKNKDSEVVASGLTVTSYSEAVAEPSDLTEFFYTVEVVCGDMTSAPAKTNTVVLGSIVPPYTSNFAADGFNGWSIIDANNDEKVWTVDSDGNAYMTYNSSVDMDDWLITPPLKLEAGKAYEVTFATWANSTGYPERIEVKYGKVPTAAGLDKVLLPATDLTDGKEKLEVDEMLVPDEDGTYYIGFHGISDADQFYLYLGNVTIESGVSSAAPGLVSDLTVKPDASGALKATVSFKTPITTMAGAALSDLTKVEVLRGDVVVKTFDAPAVGASLSFEDTLTEGGNVTYTVVGYNANGAGLKATASAFIGFDMPAAPAVVNIARTATEGEVVVSWDAVTADVNGLPLKAGDVTYTVLQYEDGEWVVKASDLTATTYSYQAVPAGEQDFVQIAVYAKTAGGESDAIVSEMIPVGKPYAGISESFANGTLGYIWGLESINGGSVSILTDQSGIPSQDGDNGMVGISSQYAEGGANFFTGLVSLEGLVNPGLTFYTYNILGESGDPDNNEISVSVRTSDESDYTLVYGPATVDDICGNQADAWGRIMVPLDNYANKVVQIQITGITQTYVYTAIDNIKVGSLLDRDLKAARIQAPGKVKTGEKYNVDVQVLNEGMQDAGNFTVELYADENLAASKAVESLAVGASTTVSFERVMSAIATESVTYFAKVVYAEDEDAENNQTSSLTVVPVVSVLPTPADLSGTVENGAIVLNWTEPNLEGGVPEEVTDDFEDADAFAAEYGDWTFVDVDGSEVGGFEGMDVPGVTPGETKGSFWIWDQETISGANSTFDAHSGNKYLFALFCYDDSQSDDWAISPELTGDAQRISFYAKSYSSSYPEKIAVYISTGSVDPNDFTLVDGSTVEEVPGEWTLYEVELPAGSKHFAIRSFAAGSFMLMVDDVTYTPAGLTANLEIAGYNVYRDGVKINDALVEDTDYTDVNVTEDVQYDYVVTVVYTDRGESAASNEIVIDLSGIKSVSDGAVSIKAVGHEIVIGNAEGLNVTIAAANGALVYSGDGMARKAVKVGNGVYVVTAGKTVRKVVI